MLGAFEYSFTAIFTADLERLKALMPKSVLEQVQPLQVWPGRGVVAFTGYAYHYCDNDSYNEISLAIVTDGRLIAPSCVDTYVGGSADAGAKPPSSYSTWWRMGKWLRRWVQGV